MSRPLSAGLAPNLRKPVEKEKGNFVALAEARAVGHAVLCPEGNTAEVAVFVHQDYAAALATQARAAKSPYAVERSAKMMRSAANNSEWRISLQPRRGMANRRPS